MIIGGGSLVSLANKGNKYKLKRIRDFISASQNEGQTDKWDYKVASVRQLGEEVPGLSVKRLYFCLHYITAFLPTIGHCMGLGAKTPSCLAASLVAQQSALCPLWRGSPKHALRHYEHPLVQVRHLPVFWWQIFRITLYHCLWASKPQSAFHTHR